MAQGVDLLGTLFQRGVQVIAVNGEFRAAAPTDPGVEPILAALSKDGNQIARELRRINVRPTASSPSIDLSRTTFPLSDVQTSFWELEQAIPASVHSSLCRTFYLVGKLESEKLKAAFAAAQHRHALLRTNFLMSPDGALQSIGNAPAVDIVRHLTGISRENFEEKVLSVVSEMFHRAFDLCKPPLLRAALISYGSNEHVLVMTAHHIICDAWSLRVLMEDVLQSYDLSTTFRSSDHVGLRFGDLVLWERERLLNGEFDGQRRYWSLALAPKSELSIAAHSERLLIRTARLTIGIEERHRNAIRSLCRSLQCTPFILLAAFFGIALQPLLQTNEIALATIVAARTRKDTERIFAPLINTLVLKADISDDPKLSVVVNRMRGVVIGALQNMDIPFSAVVREWVRQHNRPPNHICRAMIIQEPSSSPIMVGRQLSCIELPLKDLFVSSKTITSFDVTLTLEGGSEELKAVLSYKTEVFSSQEIGKVSHYLLKLIESAGEQGDRNVSSILLN